MRNITVFFSYSHKDEDLRDELAAHLSLLKRQKIIKVWHDREISAGTEWANQINENLNAADIILLLISANFLASDYCYDLEMKRAMERHQAGEARVIPIILRPCDWQGAVFGKLQALPKNGKPVIKWDFVDDALLNIVQGIRKIAEEIADEAAPNTLSPVTSKTTTEAHENSVAIANFSSPGRNVFERQPNLKPTGKLSPAFLSHCQHQLACYVGPIAKLILEDTLAQYPTISERELIKILAAEITDARKAQEFQQTIQKLSEV